MPNKLPQLSWTSRISESGPDRILVGVYWGPRGESVEQCADRIARCLCGLYAIDSCFTDWQVAGESDKCLLAGANCGDLSIIERIVVEGWARTELRNEIDPKLGTHVSLYSIQDGGAVTFATNCGITSRWVPNSCLVQPPLSGPLVDRVLCQKKLQAVLELVIACFDADNGGVYSTEMRGLMPSKPGKDNVGWMLYQRSGFPLSTKLPSESRVVPVKNGGDIIVLTDELFTARNPRHVEIAWQVANAIGLEVTDNRALAESDALDERKRSEQPASNGGRLKRKRK